MSLRTSLNWVALALLGLAIAVAVAVAASNLASRQIGIASESVSAGDSLAPPVTATGRRRQDGGRAPGGDQTGGSKSATKPAGQAGEAEEAAPTEPIESAPAETVEPESPSTVEPESSSTVPSETRSGDDSADGQGGGRDD